MTAIAARYDELFIADLDLESGPGTLVTVRNPGTLVAADLWTDETATTAAANPVTVDAGGNLRFWVKPGKYDLFANGGTLPGIVVGVHPDNVVRLNLRPVNALDPPYGADPTGAADSTAAINAALATGAPVEFQGRMKVSASLVSTGKFGPSLKATGVEGGIIAPTSALAGLPVIKFRNCDGATVKNLTVLGLPGSAPSCAIESREDHGDLASNPGGFTTTGLVVENCILGDSRPGATSNGLAAGIKWTTAGLDQNNDLARIRGVKVYRCSGPAYDIGHSNSLGHDIDGGLVANCPTVVKLAGGSFKMRGVWIGDITSWMFDFLAGNYYHPSHVGDVSVEQATLLVRSVVGCVGLILHFNHSDLVMGASSTTPISWAAAGGQLRFDECPNLFAGAGTDVVLSSPHASSVVVVRGGVVGLTDYEWAGTLILDSVVHAPGAVTLTPASAAAKKHIYGNVGGGVLVDAPATPPAAMRVPSVLDMGAHVGYAGMGTAQHVGFTLRQRTKINRVMVDVGVVGGNVCAKIYSWDGATQLATSGTVACPADGVIDLTADVELDAGNYWASVSSDTAGGQTLGYRSGLKMANVPEVMLREGGTHPLGATMSAGARTDGFSHTIHVGYQP